MTPDQISSLVLSTAEQCRQFFVDRGWVSPTWKPQVKISFSLKRKRSWGGSRYGVPFVSLALNRFVGRDRASLYEYRSFAADPVIGSVLNDTERAVRALVMHEMCHAVQYSGGPEVRRQMAAQSAADVNSHVGHGAVWKNLYRATRSELMDKTPTPTVELTAIATSHTLTRQQALRLIASRKADQIPNKQIIAELVNRYGYKKSTATTYVYSV